MKHINIINNILSAQDCIEFIQDDEAGGHNLFIGRVRASTKDRKVQRLEFESYETMAFKEMEKIVDLAVEKWNIKKIWLEHRVGVLKIGDIAVIIGVSCPHRDHSFAACRFVIDELKKTVPIWKKEVFEDGEIWVAAHP